MPAPNQYSGPLIPANSETASALIASYLDGESMQDLAEIHGVTRPRLYQILLAHAPEQWKDAQVAHAIERLERAKKGVDSAADALMLAQARESAKIAQWELERLLKRIYGPSQEVTGKDGGPLTVEIVRYSNPSTIEAEVVDLVVSGKALDSKG